MKKYTVCICDDEQPIRDKLKKYILRYSFAYDVEIDLIELDAAEKLYDLMNPYDILFLDIRFGNRSIGIDIAEELRKRGNTSIIILTTALKSMSIDGYRAEPFRFIVKPFTEEEIIAVLNACSHKLDRSVSYIKITNDSHTNLIRTDKIMYIYSKLRKRHIVCQDGAQIGTWQSLRELMDSLPSDKFAYSHKSYIVNLDMVDTVNDSKILLTDHSAAPLGLHFRDSFMKMLLRNSDI